ncbi:DUF599 domain-containing protein [Aliikangiella marina]|uniref:DUF599 domain-containing protein n=1 Tax=Aliikangiella marina TaxID=1712262 RepID=A0A545T341_9GAMM|nr:DUF599 domain-containing protein [Aliikangiella marina]TQV71641.1 DUF599 domain-containing protein [Aliikangiella marina]
MQIFSLLDWIALGFFLICWSGYALFASRFQEKVPNISKNLSQLRGLWMKSLIERDIRIADATTLGILQRTVTFFASTTILILAGLLAVLGASEKVMKLAQALPFVAEHTQSAWELKILVLVIIFIYAFFKFSWSVRQYNFALVIFGAAPKPGSANADEYASHSNDLLTAANNSFNFGLRSYNFAMAILAWFVHPILFMLLTAWVVAILYRREFHSRTLKAMRGAIQLSGGKPV